MNNKDQKIIKYSKINSIVIGFIIVIGVSFTIFRITKESNKDNSVNVGALSLISDKSSKDGINLLNAYPITVDEAFNSDDYLYTLSIKNNGNYNLEYKINLLSNTPTDTCRVPNENDEIEEKTCTKMNNNYIKYIIKNTTTNSLTIDNIEDSSVSYGFLEESTNNNVIYNGKINAGENQNFDLRLFLNKTDSNDN